jgi:glycosyltransferase involved in cell wall biosynthesis
LRLLYAFPEPLPLPRARGVQVAHAISSLAAAGMTIDLAYVPVADQSPLALLGADSFPSVNLLPLSRGWPAPLHRLPPFSRWHSARLFAARLRREIVARRPDALYVRHLKLADLLLAQRGQPPLVYEAHEVFADTVPVRRRARIAAMERRVMAGAAAVVCNSAATANRLAALYGAPRQLLVLPNGVARPGTLPAKPWAESARHIVYAGSFFGWKGVDDLIAAAAELKGFRISLIGGEAAQIERVQARLPARGAEIELVPRLPHAEVMARLAAACIAVLPNRPDPDSAFTSPIKLFEYMASGCAVVAADLPSIREILGPDDAAWFTAGDAGSLAQALQLLAANPARAQAMGDALRAKSTAYTWQARAAALRDFLVGALGGKSGTGSA